MGLGRLYAAKALKLEVPLDREVLLDGLKGPLIVLEYLQGVTMSVVARSVPEQRSIEDVRFIVACISIGWWFSTGVV